MGVKFGEAKKIISNLVSKGAKLNGGFTLKKAASTVAPVIASSMVLNELRQVPVVKEVLSGLDWLYDTLTDVVKKIPVIGWVAEPVIENVVKPVASALGGYKSKEERNDKIWYTAVQEIAIPDTADRPIQPGYNIDIVKAMEDGAVPRMYHANINLFKPYKILAWQHEMTNLWENLVNNLRRSYTYNVDDISAFMNNNIAYYILGKYLEKKIGFVKFSSPDYPTFRDDWITKYDQQVNYGMQYASKFDHLDPTEPEGFSDSIDAWNITIELERNFLLPPNIKKWIDHYIGSVFILDAEDTKNWKCIDVTPLSVTLLDIVDGKLVERNILLRNLNYQWYLKELTDWFKATATMRADVNRAQVLSGDGTSTNVLTLLDTGWFTSYDAYEPVLVKDPTFIQALINGYTRDTDLSDVFQRDMVRFDYLNEDGKGDPYTILLFAGGIMPTDTIYIQDGHITLENVAMVVGSYSQETEIRVPISWNNSSEGYTIFDHVTFSNQRVVFSINTNSNTKLTDNFVNIDQSTVSINTDHAGLTEIKEFNSSNHSVSDLAKYAAHFNIQEGLSSAFNPSLIQCYRNYGLINVHKLAVCVPMAYTCNTDVSQTLANAYNIIYLTFEYDLDTGEFQKIGPDTDIKHVNKDMFKYVAYTTRQIPGYPYTEAIADIMVLPLVDDPAENLTPLDPIYIPPTGENVGLVFSKSAQDIFVYDLASNTHTYSILDYATAGDVDLNLTGISNLLSSMQIQVTPSFLGTSFIYLNTVIGNLTHADVLQLTSDSTGTDVGDLRLISSINNFINADINTEFIASIAEATAIFNHDFRVEYAGYAEWFFSVMGYCIPIKHSHTYSWSHRNNNNYSSGSQRSCELLKEDYVPFFISRYDLAYILYYMYSSLFRIGILPYVKKK